MRQQSFVASRTSLYTLSFSACPSSSDETQEGTATLISRTGNSQSICPRIYFISSSPSVRQSAGMTVTPYSSAIERAKSFVCKPADKFVTVFCRFGFRLRGIKQYDKRLSEVFQFGYDARLRFYVIVTRNISYCAVGVNIGSVVIMVRPAADCGSSSTALSRLQSPSMFGITSASINYLMNVDLPVRTGPTTPI